MPPAARHVPPMFSPLFQDTNRTLTIVYKTTTDAPCTQYDLFREISLISSRSAEANVLCPWLSIGAHMRCLTMRLCTRGSCSSCRRSLDRSGGWQIERPGRGFYLCLSLVLLFFSLHSGSSRQQFWTAVRRSSLTSCDVVVLVRSLFLFFGFSSTCADDTFDSQRWREIRWKRSRKRCRRWSWTRRTHSTKPTSSNRSLTNRKLSMKRYLQHTLN